MVQTTERSSGSKFYIDKVDGEEKYQILDAESGDVKGEFPTRREAAAELKILLNPEEMEKRAKAAKGGSADIDDDDEDEY